MYILQQQLIDKEFHYCGLNPRLNRIGSIKLQNNETNTKPILDYDLIRSFTKLVMIGNEIWLIKSVVKVFIRIFGKIL